MTIPTNQYEADEKFDLEQDKLEERIQKRINIIYNDRELKIDSIINFVIFHGLHDDAIRWSAEQDIKNDED